MNRSETITQELADILGAEVVKSFCYTCPWQCPTEVFVRDGKVAYHRGNPEAPNNIGARCAKGMASGWITEDPDRLKHPLMRTNPKDEPGRFERVSWDTALDFVAGKLRHIEKQWGPEAVVFLAHHTPNSNFMAHLLADLYGTPNLSMGHSSGCEGDRRSACTTLFGHIFPLHDFARSKYVMLWGMNNFGANQGLTESRALLDAQRAGCKIVAIDPSFTETAQKADEWIPINPGADGAMALAMCRTIVDEGLHDAAFCRQYCVGFDGFVDHLRDKGYTPEWAAKIAGVSALTIQRLAREFATTKPALSAAFKGAGYYSNGADATRAIFLLNALVGQVDGPGNLHLRDFAPLGPPVRIPDAAKKPVTATGLAHALGYARAPLSTVRAWPDVPNSRLPDAVLNDDPYPVRGLIMQAINPVMSDPNRDAMMSMFRGLELAVAFELYLSESALECDVVLPETSFYEHAEIRQGMWMGPQAILCQPAIAPVGESRPMYDIVKDLAVRLGWGEHFLYEKWEDWAEVVIEKLPMSLDEMKAKGFWAGDIRYHRVEAGLATPSGKVEIYSQAYADAGLNPYPEYTPPHVVPDVDYPLRLTHSKLSMHCNIITQNNPLLMEICGENWVEVNSRDAAAAGIVDGAMILIESPKASIEIRAKVVEGLIPGCVSVRHGHGFGHWAMGSIAKDKGAHSNNLMDTHTDPVTGTNGYNECKVRIRPCD